jgi:ferritin-like metal-binding protein YciE
MQTLEEMFEYQIRLMYGVEFRLLDILRNTAVETQDLKMKKALAEHRDRSLGHIKRLERIFRVIGKQPGERPCHELEGFIKEKEAFAQEKPAKDLLDLFNLESARKIEQFEIASYAGLHNLAAKLRLPNVLKLLRDNLREEENFLFELKLLSPRLAPETAPAAEAPEKVA